MVKIAYFGKKRPKVFQTVSSQRFESAREEGRKKGDGVNYIKLDGKSLRYSFEPFSQLDVDDEIAKIILGCAGDIFQRVDVEESKPQPEVKVSTKGYVGDTHAERIKDLDKTVASEQKAEQGSSAEEIIEKAQSKKKKKS